VKLPAVAVDQVDHAALTKLKLGKAEQFIFVISQVNRRGTFYTKINRGHVLISMPDGEWV
jgi:hypothetical protein